MKSVMVALCTCFVVCAVANASLTALYQLDGNPNDSSINGYDGVIFPFGVPTPIWDPASADPTLNGSLTFPGSTGYSVDCGDVPVSAVSATIAYWIKADVFGNYEPLARFPDDATGQGFVVKLRAGGGVRLRVGSKSSYSDVRIDEAASDVYYAAGQWVHHAFVYTKIGSTITVDLYVDGEFVVRKTLTTTKGISAAGTHLYIGASVDTGTKEAFKGSMDDVRIYGHALSEAAIKALPGLGGDGPDVDPHAQVYYSGSVFYPFYCRTLDYREDYIVKPENLELSKYGGWKAYQVAATGFFRVEKINGRWWAIDPEGYLYLHKALNSVHLDDFTADEIYQLLPQYGFNGLGCWSDNDDIIRSSLKNQTPLAYCPEISFLGNYGSQRTPHIEMPLFDDEFVAYCNQRAQEFLKYVNDPHLFGYLSDNELSWRDGGLPAHVAITDPTDKNYITAIDFLAARGKTASNWDTEDQYTYMALMAERYYSVVSAAIKNVDSNHMYIGSRCHSTEKQIEDFMRNAGKYVDVFSMNHYHRWSSRQVEIQNMSEWSGRPLMITEYYAQGYVPDATGAGFAVLDQASRGLFYQNFVSTLAETGCVVGWHWFKFQDDGNGNKGIVDQDGTLYPEVLNEMEQMNSHIYDFIEYADSRPDPDVSLLPEADAYFKGGTNYGADPELWVKMSYSSVHRESYLRFDLSTLKNNIDSAKIHLYSIDTGSETGIFQAQLVSNNTWGEMTINMNNRPAGSTVLGSWSDGGGDIVIDVTDALLDALGTGNKLSIRIVSMVENASIPKYGSRENANPVARPQLRIHYACAGYCPGVGQRNGNRKYDARCAAVGINANANNFLTDDAFKLIQAGIDWILAKDN